MTANYNRLLLITGLFNILCFQAFAQELIAPSEGRSMVYFLRSSGTGALINFKYFDGEDYLGKFSGPGCFTYECEPGEHIFWVAAENRDFVEAELLPDKIYIIEVRPTMGMMKAAVQLYPIEKDDAKAMKKLNKFLSKNQPVPLQAGAFDHEEPKLDFFVENGMKRYQLDKEKGKLKLLAPDMYHN